jgi:hypothetical protein
MATPPKPPIPIVTPIVAPVAPAVPPAVVVPPGVTAVAVNPVPPAPAPPTGVTAATSIALTAANPTFPTDSTTQTGPSVSVKWDPTFNNLHSLTFGLTVTDSFGVKSTNVARVTVVIQPVAGITAPATVVAGTPIALDGATSMGPGLKFAWTLVATA